MSDIFYRYLGMAVWNGTKSYLRMKYGRTYMPKSVFAGAVLTFAVAAALLAAKHNGSDD
jgi:hypothetical protein